MPGPAMSEDLKAIAVQIRRERDRLRKREARAQAKRGSLRMTLTQIIVVCLLVQVCGDAGATASQWILHTKTQKRKQRKLVEEWTQDQLQLLAQLLHDERKAEAIKWRYPPNDTYARCRQKAYDYLAEARLHEWLLKKNYDTGVAPSTKELVTEYVHLWPRSGVPGTRNTGLRVFAKSDRAQRYWAYRWRRRWKVSHRKLKILPPVSEEECEKKVIFCRRFWALF